MTFKVADWFGYDISDWSPPALAARRDEHCPFIDAPCTKTFNDGTKSGVCSAFVGTDVAAPPVAICPNRLYADVYGILGIVAERAFGPGHRIVSPREFSQVTHDGRQVLALGKNYGGEVRLPSRGGLGAYFVDWILARFGRSGDLAEFAAVEVQAIDTTGTYRPAVTALRRGDRAPQVSKAGLNWENVNKRILPQLIYKGHVLRRESLCKKGLFFICPTEVYRRIMMRLGGQLLTYTNLQPGSISFLHFMLGPSTGGTRRLDFQGDFATTIDQVALAFTSPTNLPDAGVYEQAIRAAVNALK